jgi:hypothetical protein
MALCRAMQNDNERESIRLLKLGQPCTPNLCSHLCPHLLFVASIYQHHASHLLSPLSTLTTPTTLITLLQLRRATAPPLQRTKVRNSCNTHIDENTHSQRQLTAKLVRIMEGLTKLLKKKRKVRLTHTPCPFVTHTTCPCLMHTFCPCVTHTFRPCVTHTLCSLEPHHHHHHHTTTTTTTTTR